jgi:ribosomal protein S12 methylthiotransferase accessory factor
MSLLSSTFSLKRHISVRVLETDDVVLLLWEGGWQSFEGEVFRKLIPLLVEPQTVQGLTERLQDEVTAFRIMEILHNLQVYELLTERTGPADEATAFWDAHGLALTDAPAVNIRNLGRGDTNALQATLRDQGVKIGNTDAVLDVLLVDDYLDPAIAAINREMDRPWMLFKPVGAHAWIGPVFQPGQTACWECLAQRLRLNRKADMLLRHLDDALPQLTRGSVASSLQVATGLAALQVSRWLANPGQHALTDQLVTLDPVSMAFTHHAIVKRPQCPACGNPNLPEQGPLTLESRPRFIRNDGGHRTVSPEDVVRLYDYHVSPVTGIVNRLQSKGDADVIHVWASGNNYPWDMTSYTLLATQARNNSGGKGATLEQAKASGIGEALERYSSTYDGTEPSITAPYSDVRDNAIFPNDIMLYSDDQYADWNIVDRKHTSAVPQRYDESIPVKWTKVWSLSDETTVLVPTALAYYGYRELPEFDYFGWDSNGNAAGETLEAAILQGFFELIERDSVAMWFYNRLVRPGIDLDSIGDTYVDDLREHYHARDRQFCLLDLTSDFGIPAFAAVNTLVDGEIAETVAGYGAHLDPRVAMYRAVTEMNQSMPSYLQDMERHDRRVPTDDSTMFTLELAANPYLSPDPNLPLRNFADYANPEFADLRDEIFHCLDKVHALGMKMHVLDLTRPDVKMPVAKVFVPGMRHFFRRLGPGRLYDVPLKMGWLDKAVPEQDMNPLDIY